MIRWRSLTVRNFFFWFNLNLNKTEHPALRKLFRKYTICQDSLKNVSKGTWRSFEQHLKAIVDFYCWFLWKYPKSIGDLLNNAKRVVQCTHFGKFTKKSEDSLNTFSPCVRMLIEYMKICKEKKKPIRNDQTPISIYFPPEALYTSGIFSPSQSLSNNTTFNRIQTGATVPWIYVYI